MKLKPFNKYFNSLYVDKFEAFVMISLVCLYAAAEFGGIGMLAPILQYISEGPSILEGDNLSLVWKVLITVTDFFRMPLNLLSLLVLAFIPILLRQLFFYLREYFSTKVRYKVIANLRNECVTQILKADMVFFLRQGQGNLMNAVTIEAQRAGNIIFQLLNLLSSIALMFIYALLLFIIQPVLTGISVSAFFGVFLLTIPLVRRSRKYGGEVTLHNSDIFKQIADKIYGIRLIKMLSQEKNESTKIGKTVHSIAKFMIKTDLAGAQIVAITEPVVILAALIIVFIAVNLLGMPLTSLAVFLFVLYRIIPHVKTISNTWQNINANLRSFEYVERIVNDAKTSTVISSGPVQFKGLRKEILFENVSFSYDGESHDNFVLKDLSFGIPKGSFIAIVGNSGAGKSTLVDLIPRLRDATRGQVFIDGVPIRDFDLKSLRSKIGFLTQEPFLFNETVFQNIVYGIQRSVSQQQIELAARKAYANEFIDKMPLKYDTVLGDRGTRLSGGQRQRLALSRLILQDPDIIILDEYASAIDSESEKYIQGALHGISLNRTIIVIAHRLATIKEADEIFLLDCGRIIERGRFPTLMKNQKSRFRQLFETQLNLI